MEFTKLLKQGSAVLFLILLTHGLVLGFSNQTTILAIVLAAVTCLFEAQLVKSERLEQEQRIKNITAGFQDQLNQQRKSQAEDKAAVLKIQEADKAELLERLGQTHSQINAIKLSQGMRKL